jgi:succinate dehydrogenase/fumarate reductase flavoprotein subunit
MSPQHDEKDGPAKAASGVSRRDLLKLAGITVAAASTAGVATAKEGAAPFDVEVDVAVVGSGAAGATAAVFASEAGRKVVLLEKAMLFGGTTAKSGGVYWIPNNVFVREKGIEEPRDATLQAMCRYAYPQLFDAKASNFGIPPHEYALLETLYDNGPPVVDALAKMGAVDSFPAENPFGPMPDYIDQTLEDMLPRDRRLWPKKADGSFGLGDELVRQLKAALEKRGVQILLGHRVTKLLKNAKGEVIGLEATKQDGAPVRVRARQGVVFGSGGFTHNKELMLSFQPGPSYGGCAVPTNTGDFVSIAQSVGAKLGNMGSAWRAEIVLEQALRSPSTPDDVFLPPGDSMLIVNRAGKRVVNETSNYNERTLVHFEWDPVGHDWPNRILMMVYDQRTAELFGGRYPLPAAGTTTPYVISGDTWAALATAISERLASIAPRTGAFMLDPTFAKNLGATVARYDGFARKGVDQDFQRGRHLYDRRWHSMIWSFPNPNTKWSLADRKNPTMYPLQKKGPYHAILLAAGTLDTNGGPVVNTAAQVLDASDQPIPGLYGAGNCIASPTGRCYFGGGGTLGPAIVFGALAGQGVAKEPSREIA